MRSRRVKRLAMRPVASHNKIGATGARIATVFSPQFYHKVLTAQGERHQSAAQDGCRPAAFRRRHDFYCSIASTALAGTAIKSAVVVSDRPNERGTVVALKVAAGGAHAPERSDDGRHHRHH